MDKWVCQLGNGMMLKCTGKNTYKIKEMGYPYPDLISNNIDGLCSVFGEGCRSKIQSNTRLYMDLILSIGKVDEELTRNELRGMVSDISDFSLVNFVCENDGWVLLFISLDALNICMEAHARILGYAEGNAFLLVRKSNKCIDGIDYYKHKVGFKISDTIFNLGKFGRDSAYWLGVDIFNDDKVEYYVFETLYSDYINEKHGYLHMLVKKCLNVYYHVYEAAEICGMDEQSMKRSISHFGLLDKYKESIDKSIKNSMWDTLMYIFRRYEDAKLVPCGNGIVCAKLPSEYAYMKGAEITGKPDKWNKYWLFRYCFQERRGLIFIFNLIPVCWRLSLIDVAIGFYNRTYADGFPLAKKGINSILSDGEKDFYGYLLGDYDTVMAKCTILSNMNNNVPEVKYICSLGINSLCNWLFYRCNRPVINWEAVDSTDRSILCIRFFPFENLSSMLLSYIDIDQLLTDNKDGLIGLAYYWFLANVPYVVYSTKTNIGYDLDECFKRLGVNDMSEDLWSIEYELNGIDTVVNVYYGSV